MVKHQKSKQEVYHFKKYKILTELCIRLALTQHKLKKDQQMFVTFLKSRSLHCQFTAEAHGKFREVYAQTSFYMYHKSCWT